MLYLIPEKTLSYYLTNLGFPNFKCCYKSIQLFEPIYNELEIITDIIEKINWSEDKLRTIMDEWDDSAVDAKATDLVETEGEE